MDGRERTRHNDKFVIKPFPFEHKRGCEFHRGIERKKKGRCVGSVVVVKGGLVVVLIVNGTREWSFSHGG